MRSTGNNRGVLIVLSYLDVSALFFLSFTPLWLSILFIDIISIFFDPDPHKMTEKITVFLILAGLVSSAIISYNALKRRGLENTRPFTVVAQQEEKTVTSEFLLSYILPLFAFDFTKWDQVFLFLVFFVTLALLSLRYHRLTASVVLELAGYRFYRCELKTKQGYSEERIVVTKTLMVYRSGEEINLRELNNDCMLDETRES